MKLRLSICTLLVVALAATVGCKSLGRHNVPPPERLLGPGPGVDGPGPGVIPPMGPPMMQGGTMMGQMPAQGSPAQVLFAKPEGMQVRWDVGGVGQFDSVPMIVPGRNNFSQGGMYRLKLTNVPGREGVELYPTLEVGPATPRSEAFLAHNAIPVQFTEEDFDQVLTGNFVTKVIYLPDPDFQELALAGVETLVSTRLDPGVDPIVEADRRGAILGIIRLGNIDRDLPGGVESSGEVIQAGHHIPTAGRAAFGYGSGPMVPAAGGMSPPLHVAGVTGPAYGMPSTGTPIGLPGPPHVPLGAPAGLKRHTMKNHTSMHMPGPTKKVNLHVKQQPGFSYPKPASNAWIMDQSVSPSPSFHQPLGNRYQYVP